MRGVHHLVPLGAVIALGVSCNFLAPLSPDQLGETRIRSVCHFAFSCCTPIERQLFANAPFKDEGACVAESLEDPGLGFLFAIDAEAKDAIDRGAAEVDSAAAERCSRPQLDAVNECAVASLVDANGDFDFNRLVLLTDSEDPECVALASRNYTRGLVDDGDDCLSDFDCADFGSCLLDPDDVGEVLTTKGTCKALVGDGEDCSEAGCLPGLACVVGDGGTPKCQEIDLKGDGEACFADGECDSNNCAQTILNGSCTDGAPCTDDDQCPPGDFCFGESTSECAAAEDKSVEICDGL